MSYISNLTRAERLSLLTTDQRAMLNNVADRIEAEPESWWQQSYRGYGVCGTTFCIAGWALQLAEKWPEVTANPLNPFEFELCIEQIAEDLLGFDRREADFVFYGGFQQDEHVGAHKEVADWLRDIASGADVKDSAPDWW